MQASLQFPPSIPLSTSANFYLPTSPPFLFTKPSLQSPPVLPSSIPYTFFTSLILQITVHTILTTIPFPYLSHWANSGCVKGPMREDVLWELSLFFVSVCFPKAWTSREALIITDSWSFKLRNECIAVCSIWWRLWFSRNSGPLGKLSPSSLYASPQVQ